MYQIDCFWAGQKIGVSLQVIDMNTVVENVESLEIQLKVGNITQVSCGTRITLQEICVDIMQNGVLVKMYNLKK